MLLEILEPAAPIKVLPLKARKIFKLAMKELDQTELINETEMPLSRPRIRAILKKMRDNLEQTPLDDEPPAKKTEGVSDDIS